MSRSNRASRAAGRACRPPTGDLPSCILSPVEAFQAAFAPHAAEIMGDIANYTDVQPAVQISRCGCSERRRPRPPPQVGDESGWQSRQHRIARQSGRAEQFAGPVIAHAENVERALRRIEQARPVETAPEVQERAAFWRRKCRVEFLRHPFEALPRERHLHEFGARECARRVDADADDMQHGAVAGPEQRTQRHAVRRRLPSGSAGRIRGRPSRSRSSRIGRSAARLRSAPGGRGCPANSVQRGARQRKAGVIAVAHEIDVDCRIARRAAATTPGRTAAP